MADLRKEFAKKVTPKDLDVDIETTKRMYSRMRSDPDNYNPNVDYDAKEAEHIQYLKDRKRRLMKDGQSTDSNQ